MRKDKKVAVIGCGNMGEALIAGMTHRAVFPRTHITIFDASPERRNLIRTRHGVAVAKSTMEAVRVSDIIILAVKPQIIRKVLEESARAVNKSTLLISVAAGITLGFLESLLPPGTRVIRVMPNTPALIGEGAAALAGGTHATKSDMKLATEIFNSIGISVTVDESLMDAVTGLSGSGPAYVFIIIEALADAGVKLGIARDVALRLASQTLLGAARLCLAGEKTPGQLKDMVTSPGGSTMAGIKALEDGKIRGTLMNAVEAAAMRAREMGLQAKEQSSRGAAGTGARRKKER